MSRAARAWKPEYGTWLIAHYRCKRSHIWSCGWDNGFGASSRYRDCCEQCVHFHHDSTTNLPTAVGVDLPLLPRWRKREPIEIVGRVENRSAKVWRDGGEWVGWEANDGDGAVWCCAFPTRGEAVKAALAELRS